MEENRFAFDVFLSHSAKDKDSALTRAKNRYPKHSRGSTARKQKEFLTQRRNDATLRAKH